MLKVETSKGQIKLELKGNIDEIGADCCVILKSAYDAFYKEADKDTADMFAEIFKRLIAEDDDLFTPWED